MATVVLTVHLLLALGLIVVVLLQRSEGGGLGMGGGGGVMSGRAAATALSKVTWVLGVSFVVTSLALTVVAARQDGAVSVIDRLGPLTTQPADGDAAPGSPPGLGEDQLPPTATPAPTAPAATDSPSAPPAAD
jgi:preprotein translocase subunit SecG